MPPPRRVLAVPGLQLHDYGKSPRPGRKLGHCTLVAASAGERDRRVRRLWSRLGLAADDAPWNRR
jgi:5-(carboxyamino)imidazole ribonucleotide synthase